MADRELHPVHCRSCGRQVAVATGNPMHTVFCDEICADGPAFTDNEERDDMIEFLARSDPEEWDAVRLAINFELTRQGVQHVLKKRQVI